MKFKLRILTNLPLFLIALWFQSISAQENNKKVIDSLYLIVNNTNYNYKVDSYLKLTKIFIHKNLDSSIFYVDKGKNLAKKNNDTKMVVKYLIQLARIKEIQNDIYGSIEHLNEAEKYYEVIDKDNSYLTVCNYQGMYYEILSNYDMSIEKYLIGLKLSKDLNSRGYEAVFLSNLSIVYPKANQLEKSLSSSLEALAIYKEIGSKNQYFQTVKYVGNSYFNLGKYKSSKEYLNKAKNYFEKSNDHILLSDISLTLANISMNTGSQEEALELFLIAQYHALKMKGYNGEQNYKLALVNNSLGNAYFYFNDFSKAILLFKESANIGKNIKSNQILKDSYKGLYSGYLALKEFDSVTHYLSLFVPVNDSLLAEKYNEKVNALNYEYQLEVEKNKFEVEKELIESQKKNQKIFFISTLSILSLIIVVITFFWYMLKTKQQKTNLLRKNLRLEKEKLTLNLERKNKELTATLLNLIERNKFISKISENLEQIKSDEKEVNLIKIERMISKIDKDRTKNLWKEFEMTYVKVHEEFFNKISNISTTLTANETRLCALIKLNMSTKDISSITYQSEQSIKIARYRLRKKLGLFKNENLTSFLHSL